MKESNFQFAQPFLTKIDFLDNVNFNYENENVEVSNSFTINTSMSENENSARVELILKVDYNQNKEFPFKLEAGIASYFRWEDDVKKELVDQFLKTNAPALLLSYLRPIVASVTNSSRFPVYNIPFFNFQDSDNDDN